MAIDITTNKNEGSSAFGERLVGNVRENNRAKEKAFFNRQKRERRQEEFKEVGLSFGTSLANSFISKNTEDFLATEAQAGNVLATRNAHKFSEQIQADIKKIAGYTGGEDAYWNAQGEARARLAIEADIAKKFDTTFYYNKEKVDVQVKGIGATLGQEMRNSHNDRVTANNTYMSSLGVDDGRDAYITAIKSTQPQNITDVASGVLKKLLGMSPDERISATASNILETSQQLNDFQQLYKTSGDAVLAAALAREFPEGKDLGSPVATIGTTVKEQTSKDFLGVETTYFTVPVTRKNRDGSITTTMMYLDTAQYKSTGNIQVTGKVTSPTNIKNRKDFGEIFAGVKENPTYINFGAKTVRDNLNPSQVEVLNKQIQELAKGKGGDKVSPTDIGKNQVIIEENLHSEIATATFIMSKDTDLSLDEAGRVTMQMFNDNPDLSGQGAFAFGTGKKTPFATLNAIIKVEDAGDLRYSRQKYDQLAGNNGENFVSAYISATANERKSMEKNLATILAHGESEEPNDSIPYAELATTLVIAKQINAESRDADVPLSTEIAIRRQVMDNAEKERKRKIAEENAVDSTQRQLGTVEAGMGREPIVPDEFRSTTDTTDTTDSKLPSYYTDGDAPSVGGMSIDNLARPLTPTGKLPKLKTGDIRTWVGDKQLEPQAKLYVEIKDAIEEIITVSKQSTDSPYVPFTKNFIGRKKEEYLQSLEAKLITKYKSYQKEYGGSSLTSAQQREKNALELSEYSGGFDEQTNLLEKEGSQKIVINKEPKKKPEPSLLSKDPTMFRADGTSKSAVGYLGPIENAVTGAIMTEFSTDLGDRQGTQIPTLVPGQSDKAIEYMRNMNEGQGFDSSVSIEKEIIDVARKHANERIEAGLSPFYTRLPTASGNKGSLQPIPKSIVEKIEYVGRLLGDNENGIQFMKRVVNQESRNGEATGTYEISSDGKGSFGVAQVDKVAFDAVQRKLRDKNSRYSGFVKTFKDATNMDLTKVQYSALGNDTLSIAFGRLYLMQLTAEKIPTTLDGRAAYWKKYYNTPAGAGTVAKYIRNNS